MVTACISRRLACRYKSPSRMPRELAWTSAASKAGAGVSDWAKAAPHRASVPVVRAMDRMVVPLNALIIAVEFIVRNSDKQVLQKREKVRENRVRRESATAGWLANGRPAGLALATVRLWDWVRLEYRLFGPTRASDGHPIR